MNPKSHTLFHFTKTNDTLKNIIRDGFWPRFCLEDIGWLGYELSDYVAYPMVCFCDIPISRVDEHVKFYGEYGIGLTKEWAMANKFTPVLYVASNSHIPKRFREIATIAFKLAEEEQVSAMNTLRYLLAHSKPTEGNMVIGSDVITKEFHQESEWRYVPIHDDIKGYLTRKDFEDSAKLEERNNLTKRHCVAKFTPKDVKYIFVRNDSDIPDIINFIQSELDSYPGADLKILMSRVTSLESISRDL